jgi:hypothetical protein
VDIVPFGGKRLGKRVLNVTHPFTVELGDERDSHLPPFFWSQLQLMSEFPQLKALHVLHNRKSEPETVKTDAESHVLYLRLPIPPQRASAHPMPTNTDCFGLAWSFLTR